MTYAKRIICLLLSVLFVLSLAACGNDEEYVPSWEKNQGESGSENGDKNDQNSESGGNGGGGNTEKGDKNDQNSESGGNGGGGEQSGTLSFFDKYKNVVEIGDFHNGIAMFKVSSKSEGWSDSLVYSFGYLDIQGNVIVEPTYSRVNEIPTFEGGNYIRLVSDENVASIIDKTGKVQFTVGKDNVTDVGTPTNGYFWVETSKEEFIGYVYTTTYYSAKDMSVVATFENCEAENYTWSGGWINSGSNVDENGNAAVEHAQNGNQMFNISTYDPNFKAPTNEDEWTIDVDKMEAFQGVDVDERISSNDNTLGRIATVVLKNKDKIYYYSTVDQNGNVLLAPQKNIVFENTFRKDLCPAQDVESGLWGYIDPYGNWKIEPQFTTATAFSGDGYAIVNLRMVIDTNGKTVLAPNGWTADGLKTLSGTTYQYVTEGYRYTLTFSADGQLAFKRGSDYAWVTSKAEYTLSGGTLMLSNTIGGLLPGTVLPVWEENGSLYINGLKWTRVETES